ncbi:MAG TPA: hypothetical protein P5121_15100 [Caldilineaceae bacterium]|nr:hypothetical protein [Caldilineaceae bacterium]
MDTTAILIGIVIIALLAFYFYNRSKPAPRGTYDDKRTRSSGSIGGGTRAHDDPNVRSSGSIGGGTRGHDSPEHRSGGSIGGRQQSENEPNVRRVEPEQTRTVDPDRDEVGVNGAHRNSTLPRLPDQPEPADRERNVQRSDDPAAQEKRKDEFRSGGSFGGSRH